MFLAICTSKCSRTSVAAIHIVLQLKIPKDVKIKTYLREDIFCLFKLKFLPFHI